MEPTGRDGFDEASALNKGRTTTEAIEQWLHIMRAFGKIL
jgi:hypothetical protein